MMKSIAPLKRFGQNFLTDRNIISKIIASVVITSNDNIFEIGPGRGSLTEQLSRSAKNVIAVEIDRGLCDVLSQTLGGCSNVEIVCADVLRFNLKSYAKKKRIKKFKVVANLPYYITTPVIEYLFENIDYFSDIFIMVQKEVALRISSKAGSKTYGSFSCFVNYYSKPKVLFHISPNSFFPAPKIDSSFLRLEPIKDPKGYYGVKSEELLFNVIRSSFGQRRKQLFGVLAKEFGRERLSSLGCRALLERRAENLTLQDFILLSNQIFDFSRRNVI